MSLATLKSDEGERISATVADRAEVYRTTEELERLVSAFERCTLPKEEFTHSAHVTVAFWYLYHFTGQVAATRIREGIKRYAAAQGVPSTPTGGYHETITLFWVFAIGKYLLLENGGKTLLELANGVVEKYSDKAMIFEHYSRDRLFSIEARNGWVEPDLRPLG